MLAQGQLPLWGWGELGCTQSPAQPQVLYLGRCLSRCLELTASISHCKGSQRDLPFSCRSRYAASPHSPA